MAKKNAQFVPFTELFLSMMIVTGKRELDPWEM